MASARIACLALSLLPALAWADGGCDFDRRFIGKNIIGYVHPFALEGIYNAGTGDADATTECMVQTYTGPNGTPTSAIPCPRFYLSAAEYAKNPHSDNYRSDYFTLDVKATRGAFVQLPLAEKKRVWAKLRDAKEGIKPIRTDGAYPDNAIFLSPDRTRPAPPSKTLRDPAVQQKIRSLFAGTAFEKLDVIGEIARRYKSGDTDPLPGFETFYADFTYTPVKEIIAADGSRWLKATERFIYQWWWEDQRNKPPKPNRRFARDTENSDDGLYWTAPLRTVYIPLRAADGTILNAAGDGNLYCD